MGAGAGWVLPSIGLALVPKCPLCVMAYVAALTGLGISYSAASLLRQGLIWVCIGVLLFAAGRWLLLAARAFRGPRLAKV